MKWLVTVSLLPKLKEQHRVEAKSSIAAVRDLLSREDVQTRFAKDGALIISALPAKPEFGDKNRQTESLSHSGEEALKLS